ncbi:RNA polymerase sigma factor [Algoriphagus antarcticus]|uniref:RNA polymerase sigma factor (Sigma-70 family) n=1 Tax=Algoriphagus antarcticus TaxID=238540 RepID=A0A3E0DN61_9BACT|nr:sigma-70 family RNA polymerase sigma factor [Algoriphagus antarcticus]REG83558.1 RNA polymerase sigma factor (sigma-70 family) [Algoriphagus antarcticus]
MPRDIFKTFSQNEITHAICQNDEVILRQIYEDGFPKVRKFVRANHGNDDEAKDIFQEAFLALWQNVKKGAFIPTNQTAIQGYLFQVAKNKWLDWVRSARFKRDQKHEDSFFLNQSSEPLEESLEDKYELVEQSFGKLGDDCQEILKSFYFLKKNMDEIATKFGWTPQTVKNNKYRCMEKLRKFVLQN